MKRHISMILVLLLCALMLPGCKQSAPSTPGSTPQLGLPTTSPTTTTPTEPNPLVTVYLLTGYTVEGTGEAEDTTFVYDDANRLVEVLIGSQVVVERTYDDQGNCLSYKDTLRGIDQTYDAQGKILTDRTEEGSITNTYDEAGRCIQIERHSPDGTLLSVTRYTYNERGDVLSEILEQDGSVYSEILHTYDAEGRHLTATYYRDGKISDEAPSYEWKYDDRGRLTYENIYYGEVFYQGTNFTFEPKTCLYVPTMRWDSAGNFWSYSIFYDTNGNISQYHEKCRASDGTITYYIDRGYGCDTHGNTIILIDDNNGVVKTYHWTYDETGTIMLGCSLASDAESYEYAWVYDAGGRVLQEIRTGDAPHEITYVYDQYGNLIQQRITADSVTTVTNYTYTALSVMPEIAAQLRKQQAELQPYMIGDPNYME